jgi:Domain of unknown function (DUF4234)/Short C-terminal domain
MATEVFIAGSEYRAKKRNPWGVLGLAIITLGIYLIFWWYFVNREMRDLGRARGVSGLGDNPGLSTAAYVLGGFTLYIATVWTVVTTTQRVQRSERVAEVRDPLNGWIAALVWIFTLGIGGPILLQHHLNKVWENEPEVPPALPGGAPRGDADLERLRKLTELKDSGAISEEEFAKEKARVLPTARSGDAPAEPEGSE